LVVNAEVKDSWIGRTLGGRYKIIDVIGEGGMGVVYSAKQISVDREVAIKMMHARAAQDPQWSERFQSEAKACSLLTHPNTIRLYDFGKTTLGNFYMVMELLTGQTLTTVVQEQAPMAPGRVLRILMQCCASLSEAHKAGIIHRDIKPDNIFVQKLEGADDFIKLIDFSIAKRLDVAMTAAGIVMGTPQFMSPEQGRGQDIDHRSDLYSLGIVAYFMLCGRLPFHDEDPLEVLRMHQTMEVPPMNSDVPNSVAKLVTSCLEKNAARRPASALALLEACKIWLTEIDPTLDVASDPILKNTLVSGGPTVNIETTTYAQSPSGQTRPSSSVKTMLGASGAIGADWSQAQPPEVTRAIPDKRTAKTSISDSNQTLIHQGGEGLASAAAVAAAEISDSARTLIQEGDSSRKKTREQSDSKRTSIQSPSGAQRSDSEEIRLETGRQRARVPTNRPTVNEFSSSPAPPVDAGAAAPPSPGPQNLSPARAMALTTVSANVAPPAGEPSAEPYGVPAGEPYGVPAGEPYGVPSGESYGEVRAPAGRGGFFLACLLVAVTFGFGAYFLTSTLR
jgi:serine/threonine protein kinase